MSGPDVRLAEVTADNWRAVAALRVTEEQRRWVAEVTYYLALCTYGDTWHPLAIERRDQGRDGPGDAAAEVVGFLMWGVDDDRSRWIGGLVIGADHQGRGIGRAATAEAVRMLSTQPGCTGIALSVAPDNAAASALYRSLGFEETGETEDDGAELVMRRPPA